MRKQEFISLLNDAVMLDRPVETGAETIAELGNWDSMSMVEFQIFANEHFDATVEPEDLARCETVKELAELLGQEVLWSETELPTA